MSSFSSEDREILRYLRSLERAALPKFDPVLERERSLLHPVTQGAEKASPLHPLPVLRAIIAAQRNPLVIVSDVHGQYELLCSVLTELGLLAGQQRTAQRARVVSVGDLIDGRNEDDERTLLLGTKVFDCIVAGNHEVAYLGGRRFEGQPPDDPDGLEELLREAVQMGILQPSYRSEDVLVTHAGVSQYFAKRAPLDEVVVRLNSAWDRFLKEPRGRGSSILNGPSPARGGNERFHPGCWWQDWTELLLDHPKQFRQIVGHTPRGHIERSQNGHLYNIDAAGFRLGIAVVLESGTIEIGSDFIPPPE